MYLFSADAVSKIQRDHQRLAYTSVSPTPSRTTTAPAPMGPVAQIYPAKTTSAICEWSSSSPGSGTAKICKRKSDGDLDSVSDGDLTVYNIGGSVEASKFCLIAQDTFGSWWLIVVPCE